MDLFINMKQLIAIKLNHDDNSSPRVVEHSTYFYTIFVLNRRMKKLQRFVCHCTVTNGI